MIPGPRWEIRALRALVLLMAFAYGVRWAYDQILPALPFLIGIAIVGAVVSVILTIHQRRRW